MTSLDLYCERCSPDFWAEPWNALTNISFLIAAFFARQLAARHKVMTLELSGAIALAVLIGIGSFLFHTFANTLTVWFDIVPIVLLQCWFVWLYSRRIIKLPVLACSGLLVILVGGGIAGSLVPRILNGSLGYVPAIVILAGMAIWHFRKQRREPYVLILGTAAFLIALLFRSIDLMVCPVIPVGTHFLWHLFNGGTVYFAIRCLILNLPRGPVVNAGNSK